MPAIFSSKRMFRIGCGDAGVAADPELADEPRALVDVERREQLVLALLGRRLDDPALAERRGGCPRARARRRAPSGTSRTGSSPRRSPRRGEKKNSPPGMFTWPSSTSPLPPAQRDVQVGLRADDAHLVGRVEAVAVAAHPLALGVPVAQARAVEEVLERGQRHARLLRERVGRELAADPRDLVRHRAPEERRLRPSSSAPAARRRVGLPPRVFSGASIVIRASMWSEAKRSIGAISPTQLRGASAAQALVDREERRSSCAGAGRRRAARSAGSAPRSAAAPRACVRISTCQPGLDVEPALDEQLGVLARRAGLRERPCAVLLDDLAVELDPAAAAAGP